jgi:hypothetical protein
MVGALRALEHGDYEPPHHEAKLEDFFGYWDPETGVVTFWEHSISIPDIVGEVAHIHPLVRGKVEGPFGRE